MPAIRDIPILCWSFLAAISTAAYGELPPLLTESDITVSGDFIGGFYSDDALGGSSGRESQIKLSRGILGVGIEHPSGFGGILEYNFLPDETKRDPGDSAYFDYYNNLGTDILYYGKIKARNAYISYKKGDHFTMRFGRMVNLTGFDLDNTPFWGRLHAPHAFYLDKELITGLYSAYLGDIVTFEGAIFGGGGRPDSDYNWYLGGKTDPNFRGNSDLGYELNLSFKKSPFLLLSLGYHNNVTGSAPGNIFSGKHNDIRYNASVRLETPKMGKVLNRFFFWGQVEKYKIGLREDGQQGDATPVESQDLEKEGFFVTGGMEVFAEKVRIFATYEEIDRIDSLVWSEVTQYDPNHWAMDSKERSVIVQINFYPCRYIILSVYYRTMDFDFGEISGIPEEIAEKKNYDKYGLEVRLTF